MKSTEVQNPRRKSRRKNCILRTSLGRPRLLAYYPNARTQKLATPRVVAETRGAVSSRSIQHGLVTSVGIVLGKAECSLQSLGTF